MITLAQFVDKYNNKTVDFDLSIEPGFVKDTVVSSVGQNKIFNPIVKLISVYVVDYFIRFKFATKVFFHNISLLFHVSASSNKNPVITTPLLSSPLPIWMPLSLHMFNLAFSRTINKLTSFVAFIVFKTLRAVITKKQSLSRFVITLSTAKYSTLRWWGIKFFRTLFTEIDHIINYSTR